LEQAEQILIMSSSREKEQQKNQRLKEQNVNDGDN
jgi:hypothetical protein